MSTIQKSSFLSLFLFWYLYLPFLCLSFARLYVCLLSFCLFPFLLFLIVFLSVFFPFCSFDCLSVCLPVYLFFFPINYLSVLMFLCCLSVYVHCLCSLLTILNKKFIFLNSLQFCFNKMLCNISLVKNFQNKYPVYCRYSKRNWFLISINDFNLFLSFVLLWFWEILYL